MVDVKVTASVLELQDCVNLSGDRDPTRPDAGKVTGVDERCLNDPIQFHSAATANMYDISALV